MKSISVIALEQVIEQLEQQKKSAMNAAAKPFNDKIASIRMDIAKLEGTEINSTVSEKRPYSGAKRGRKPAIASTIQSFVYPLKGTVISKLLYSIKELGRFATIAEIATVIKTYEPHMPFEFIKDKFGKHIDKYRTRGYIVSYRIGSKRNTVYGLPAWLKDGKAIEGREHDPDALIDKVFDIEDAVETYFTAKEIEELGKVSPESQIKAEEEEEFLF